MNVDAWATQLAALVREYLDLDAEWRGIPNLTFHTGHVEAVRYWQQDVAQKARLKELRARMREHLAGGPTT